MLAENASDPEIGSEAAGLLRVLSEQSQHLCCATLTLSQLIDAGVDIVTISKRLGHAKPDITLRIYAHLFRKDDGKAAAAINSILGP